MRAHLICLAALCCVAPGLLVACGAGQATSASSTPATAAGTGSKESASATPVESSSPSLTTSPPASTVAPSPTNLPSYNETYGGLEQLVLWRLLPGARGVELYLAQQHAGLQQRIRLRPAPGSLAVELYDVVPLPTVLRPATASGPIVHAGLYFTQDDALVILRLALADTTRRPQGVVRQAHLSPTMVRVTITLRE